MLEGENITIAGNGFGTNRGTVYIGDLVVSVGVWNDDEIIVTNPGFDNGQYVLKVIKGTEGCASYSSSRKKR